MAEAIETYTNEADTNPGPSLQESFDALKKEGVVSDDVNGAIDAEPDPDAQGGAEGTEGGAEERPSWLPDEFKTVEEFKAAYEALKGGDKAAKEDEGSAEETPSGPSEDERVAAEEATKKAGLSLADVSQKFLDKGELDQADYDALAKAGFPRKMVDTYAKGLMAENNAIISEVHNVAGGENEYSAMLDWAIHNLSQADQDAFDVEINSGNKVRVMNAVKALKVDYKTAQAATAVVEPEAPVDAKGKAPANVYLDESDYLEDLNDPRYARSESFRRKVAEKLSRSNI